MSRRGSADSPRSPAEVPALSTDNCLREAYHAHGAELYRFALRQLGDEGSAQDAVQETFLRAWRHAERLSPEVADLRVWLFAIIRNVVIDETRRHRARPWRRLVEVGEHSEPVGRASTPGVEDEVLDAWLVEEALLRISPEHRQALVDVHLRGRPQPEVAAELGIPVGTLRSRVFYGMKALRLALEEMGVRL